MTIHSISYTYTLNYGYCLYYYFSMDFWSQFFSFFSLSNNSYMYAMHYEKRKQRQKEREKEIAQKYILQYWRKKNKILKGIVTTVADSITWNASICRKYRKDGKGSNKGRCFIITFHTFDITFHLTYKRFYDDDFDWYRIYVLFFTTER